MKKYDVDPDLLEVELTESSGYTDYEALIIFVEKMNHAKIRTSIDDFGTGYSSLSLLTEMPLDTLKIDKSFVDKLGTSHEREEDITVIRLIITLARELSFTCLAEGAEKIEQVDRLRYLGCNVIQGYYYSKPIPIDEFEERYL